MVWGPSHLIFDLYIDFGQEYVHVNCFWHQEVH